MQGIELSRRFFADVVGPWLAEAMPGVPYAAALVGYGSELLGFDDDVSRDHNWGPRVHVVLTRGHFAAQARRLVAGFGEIAPEHFLGEPIGWRNRPHPPAGGSDAAGALEHGLEFHTLEGLLERMLGLRAVEDLAPADWLGLPEQRLLAFTAGAVFHDGDGRLSAARAALAYLPRDVWLYKVACQWRRLAEEQAFVGRTGQVGDDLGSRIIAARLVRDAMRMAFLLEQRYAPYAKWFGSAFARLPMARTLGPQLRAVQLAEHWVARGDALAAVYLELAQRQNALGVGPFTPVLGPYFGRPFTTINADDAVAALSQEIADPAIRALPIVGSIDQMSDATPVLEDPLLSQRLARQLG